MQTSVGDVSDVVVGEAVDQDVTGVDSGAQGLLVDDNLHAPGPARQPVFPAIEGFEG